MGSFRGPAAPAPRPPHDATLEPASSDPGSGGGDHAPHRLLRRHLPELAVPVVNLVDMTRLLRQLMADARTRQHAWIREHGTDLPEVTDWTWTA
ncbi:hypothetical protein [Streptomyces sp. R35]|uniref:Xylulose 5-phosphate/Fructose 6-phosphate phosphoketolase C-terminal domain-containing protein n=1 Tax=Streptomyces sp. R35 TaxID=3238630 RepID=A0AB39SR98_9ACTN